MTTESVLWTALPNGVRGGGDALGLTVYVSPRLSTDGPPSRPLTDFPAFSDWPAALSDIKLAVEIENVGVLDTGPDADSTPADQATWKLVFGGDVGVVSGEFTDLSERRVRSFPAADVDDHVLGLYADVASTFPTGFPPVTTGPLASLADELGNLGDARDDLYKRLDSGFDAELSQHDDNKRGRYLPRSAVPPGEQRRFAFLQAYRFYDRFTGGKSVREPHGPMDPSKVAPPPKLPEIDFHGYIAFLGDYPLLLRPLGIAIDLVARAVPGMPPEGRVRLHVETTAPLAWAKPVGSRPWTNYQLDGRRFIAQPRQKEGDLIDGTLRLESERHFRVHQIDVDGSALKTVDFAATVMRLKDHVKGKSRSMTADEASLPALRGVGFTVSRRDRAAHVVEQFDEATLHQQALEQTPPQPANLFAEDVTRGYRVDVEPEGDRFRSLCERTGTYVVETPNGPEPILLPPDEGYTKGSSTTSVPDDKEELYLHEGVFSWAGWSLVAERPGQRVMPDETIDDGTTPTPTDPGVPLVTNFHATPGTLPRLRYGAKYRFRARAVDLAGNSVGEDAIDPSHASDSATFLRWEPVPSPAVIPRRPFGEGESLLRIVIRSTLGIAPVDYVVLSRVVSLTGHTDPLHAYRDADERWLAAPKTSQQMAEFHGMFDPSIGENQSQSNIDKGFDIGAREAGSFLMPVPGAFVFNPGGNPATDLNTLPAGAPLQPGEYVCIDTNDLALPYLPDVASRAVSFTTLPNDTAGNTPSHVIAWPDGGAWFERQPIRVRIESGPAAAPVTPMGALVKPDYDATNRVLTVHVPQAEMIAVQISSAPKSGDVDVMGVWSLLAPAAQLAQRPDAENGRAWMLTPSQTLVFVHAVEKPLLAPAVDVADSGMQRNLGETFCALAGSIDNHAKSTGRLDIEAAWSEQIDDVLRDLPEDGADGRSLRPGFAHVGDFSLDPDEDDCRTGRDDMPRSASKPPVHQLRHEFADTRHRRVGYHSMATTRFREYFPPEVINGVDSVTGEQFITHVGAEKELRVPSSRRPEPPEILYVLPTFTWSEETLSGLVVDSGARPVASSSSGRRSSSGSRGSAANIVANLPKTFRRLRQGGGLRVYLRRPWFSSGDGELLGVVLKDQPWITWPIDEAGGLFVDAAAKANADAVATRLFERGVIQPKGAARLASTERLVASLGSGRSFVEAAGAFSLIDGVLDEFILAVLGGIDPDKLVTHWGSDPIWGSALPAGGPYIHQFPLRVAVGTGLSLAETNKATVAVVGHRPQYDPIRQLWFCDLQINAGSSYFPFVRPALCRYQPNSITGAHVSRVVLADYAQLVADRTSSLTKSRGSASVSVRGPAGYGATATFLGVNTQEPGGIETSRFVTAQIERLSAGGNPDLGWNPVGDEVRLEAEMPGGVADVRWSGSVAVPTKPQGAEQRIAIREYEILESDPQVADGTFIRGAGTEFPQARPVRYRLVYADHLAV